MRVRRAVHDQAVVREEEWGRLVLRCRCGWASAEAATAAEVGAAWDRHLAHERALTRDLERSDLGETAR